MKLKNLNNRNLLNKFYKLKNSLIKKINLKTIQTKSVITPLYIYPLLQLLDYSPSSELVPIICQHYYNYLLTST